MKRSFVLIFVVFVLPSIILKLANAEPLEYDEDINSYQVPMRPMLLTPEISTRPKRTPMTFTSRAMYNGLLIDDHNKKNNLRWAKLVLKWNQYMPREDVLKAAKIYYDYLMKETAAQMVTEQPTLIVQEKRPYPTLSPIDQVHLLRQE